MANSADAESLNMWLHSTMVDDVEYKRQMLMLLLSGWTIINIGTSTQAHGFFHYGHFSKKQRIVNDIKHIKL